VAAFDAKERRDAARLHRPLQLVRGAGQHEVAGITRDDASRRVDLLELRAHEAGRVLGGDVDRPELAAHRPLAQPLEVRGPCRALAEVVAVYIRRHSRHLADLPGKVVVAVHDRVLAEELARVRERRVVLGDERRGGEEGDGGGERGQGHGGRLL
jgi:hypothetical protein